MVRVRVRDLGLRLGLGLGLGLGFALWEPPSVAKSKVLSRRIRPVLVCHVRPQ